MDHQDVLREPIFTNLAPLGRVGLRIAMSGCLFVCLFAPSGAVSFEAYKNHATYKKLPKSPLAAATALGKEGGGEVKIMQP